MSYSATILADSLSPDGVRLTTLEVTFPRFILAEVNTHRMLSRNSASSRAIPTEKIIERVRENPFVPETFNQRIKGMGVGDPMVDVDAMNARSAWMVAMYDATKAAERLVELNVDKSRANRLLEPFMWHTAIISATDWENFFALRDHEAAQPEFRITAQAMKKAMAESDPLRLEDGEWHLPLVDLGSEFIEAKETNGWKHWAYISASRCARVSYNRQHDDEDYEKTEDRALKLKTSGHLSPFEHPARPLLESDLAWQDLELPASEAYFGNFKGWYQMRKMIPGEANFAEAVRMASQSEEV
jgi:thymidylate synthase ThyX